MNQKYVHIGSIFIGILAIILGIILVKWEIDSPTLGEHIFILVTFSGSIIIGMCLFIVGLHDFVSNDIK
jgi:hypothetical protein